MLSARVRHAAGDLAGALDQYVEADGGPPATRQVADVWFANALLHAGRPAEALAHVEHALRSPPGPHPFAPLHARWSRTLALAYLGRLAEAFDSIDDLDRIIERSGVLGSRFIGPARNIRGYLLRNANLSGQADESNRAALEHTSGPGGDPATDAMVEAYWVAHLDLTEGRLAVGDHAGAADLLARMEAMRDWQGTMAWHQRHRLGLLRARLALADGDREAAAVLAIDVVADARERRALRYVVLAEAVVALAGGSHDLDAIGTTVDGLGRCAALEAWWLTAELGRQFDVDAWTQRAGRQAAELTRAAGPYGSNLNAWIGRHLVYCNSGGQEQHRSLEDGWVRSERGDRFLLERASRPGFESGQEPGELGHAEPPADHLGRSEVGERHRPRLDHDLGQACCGGYVADPVGRRQPRDGLGVDPPVPPARAPSPAGGGLVDDPLDRMGVVGGVGRRQHPAPAAGDPRRFTERGDRIVEVVQGERRDHGVEDAVGERQLQCVTDHGGWPPIAVDQEHPDRHVDSNDRSGAGTRRGPAGRPRASAEIEHNGAVERYSRGRELLARHDVVDPRRAAVPRLTRRRVGIGDPAARIPGVPSRHRRFTPARARSHHHPSSVSSPSAFSQPNWTSAPSKQSPSWRSNHPAVVTP